MATTEKGPDNPQYLTGSGQAIKLPNRLTAPEKCATIKDTKESGTQPGRIRRQVRRCPARRCVKQGGKTNDKSNTDRNRVDLTHSV